MDDALEARIRDHWDSGDHEAAATHALRGYGPEVYGFLSARLRDEDLAADAFSELGEDLWRGIGGFGWRSSFRTWMYTVARNAALRVERSPHRRRRTVPLSRVSQLVEDVRSGTKAHDKTENRDALAALRAELSPDEQTLLTLRVDRTMSWSDIALVMLGDDAAADLPRASARMRQRFKQLKQRLRRRGQELGLVSG